MSFVVESAIQEQVTSGERVLWSGRPLQGLVMRAGDAVLIPFSLFWGGFAFFFEYQMLTSSEGPGFGALLGLPFVVVGLYLIVGRFFFEALQRAHTVYGVTNQRVIVVSGMSTRKVTSLMLRTMHDVVIEEKGSHRGTIRFGLTSIPAWTRSGAAWPGFPSTPSFEMIENPKAVFEIIRQAQAGE
jgi:PH (Pleckstrin Homology) domain-containing protein